MIQKIKMKLNVIDIINHLIEAATQASIEKNKMAF